MSREDSYLVGFVGGIPNHIHLTPYQEGLRWCLVNIQSVDWVGEKKFLLPISEVSSWYGLPNVKAARESWIQRSTRSPTNYVEIIACMCDHLLGDWFAGHKLSFRAQRMS